MLKYVYQTDHDDVNFRICHKIFAFAGQGRVTARLGIVTHSSIF